MSDHLRYHVYIIRCWAESGRQSDTVLWRYSLHDPTTGERHGFGNLEAVLAALRRELTKAQIGTKDTTQQKDSSGRH